MSAFSNERDAGRAAMPDDEFSAETSRAMLAALYKAEQALRHSRPDANHYSEARERHYDALRAVRAALDMAAPIRPDRR